MLVSSLTALGLLIAGIALVVVGADVFNAKGLPGAAAGTFLGGTSFLACGVAGLGALIAPMQARLPLPAIGWTAAAPLPLLLLSPTGP